jgi:hypothetical protein
MSLALRSRIAWSFPPEDSALTDNFKPGRFDTFDCFNFFNSDVFDFSQLSPEN